MKQIIISVVASVTALVAAAQSQKIKLADGATGVTVCCATVRAECPKYTV